MFKTFLALLVILKGLRSTGFWWVPSWNALYTWKSVASVLSWGEETHKKQHRLHWHQSLWISLCQGLFPLCLFTGSWSCNNRFCRKYWNKRWHSNWWPGSLFSPPPTLFIMSCFLFLNFSIIFMLLTQMFDKGMGIEHNL